MSVLTATTVTAIVLTLTAAAATAYAHSSLTGSGNVDTRTAKQYDDYNPSIKPPPFDYHIGGGSANTSAKGDYKQDSAQSLQPLPGMLKQDRP